VVLVDPQARPGSAILQGSLGDLTVHRGRVVRVLATSSQAYAVVLDDDIVIKAHRVVHVFAARAHAPRTWRCRDRRRAR
jgi:hypothetical protein